jgi:Uma2 family endonuclease
MRVTARPVGHPPAVLHDIDWQTYGRLLRALQGRRRYRLTYDRGTLEIMSPLWKHGAPAYLMGRFIDILTDEFQMLCRAGGLLTLRRKKKQRGLEPDNCYWIANAEKMDGKLHLDLRTDPPPDLAVEVDVTHSSLDRLAIYASLGVPEVWRLSASGLAFYILHNGAYEVRSNSLAFPLLASADLEPFLAQVGKENDSILARQFREWLRQVLLARGATP